MTTRKKILVIGAGGLGSALVAAARTAGREWDVLLVDRDLGRAEEVARGAMALGLGAEPVVRAGAADATRVDEVAELIRRERPDAVVNLATLLPVDVWWEIAARDDIGAEFDRLGFGPWIALHLVIASAVAEAVASLDERPVFVNAAYPDVINAVLSQWHGLPVAGAGNIRLLEPGARLELSRKLGLPPQRFEMRIAAHYIHVRAALMRAAALPTGWSMSVRAEGALVDLPDAEEVLLRAGAAVPMAAQSHSWTAVSIVEDLSALLGEGRSRTHMAGPAGLIGGLPVRIGRGVVELDPDPGWAVEEVAEQLRAASRLDGIEGISADGALEFTAAAQDAYARIVGQGLPALAPASLASSAAAQLAALREVRAGRRPSSRQEGTP